jgi:hypothetical protein
MKWIRERDALIAQTLAFVHSVSGRKVDFRQSDTVAAPPVLAAEIVSVDFRSEMQARIANFRKHQERFEREREEYCAATLIKLRAAIRDPSTTRPPTDE